MGRRNYIHQADRFFNANAVNTQSTRPVIDIREPIADGNTGVVQTNIGRTSLMSEEIEKERLRGQYTPPVRGRYTGTAVEAGTGRGQYTPPVEGGTGTGTGTGQYTGTPVEGGTGTGTGTGGSPEPPPTPPEDPIIPDSPETPDVPTPPIVNIVTNPSIPSGGLGGGGSMGGGSSDSTPIQKKSWIPLILAVGGIAVMILKPIK